MSSLPKGTPCYALVWEGVIGAFYEIDSELNIIMLADVMHEPGHRYALLYGHPAKPDLASSHMDRMADLGIRSIYDNEDGPNISGEAPDQRVQYGAKRVKHHVPCQLPELYFRFESDEAVRSFTINVRLVAANIRKPKDDALHVEIERAAPGAPPSLPEPDEEQED